MVNGSGTIAMEWIGSISQMVIAIMMVATWAQSRSNGKKIEEVHKATNSMKDELVKTTGDAKFAEGLKQGQGQGQ